MDLLIIENVGNLVCPASFDLGEEMRVVLLSVTEGEDKPLKYPPIFSTADAVIVSKMDLAEAVGVQMDSLRANIRRASPRAKIFELSAKTGVGLDEWCEYLGQRKRSS
jgi:hydrogenase nickel incorporation protein HypB